MTVLSKQRVFEACVMVDKDYVSFWDETGVYFLQNKTN